MSKGKTITVGRSSVTGRFVPPSYVRAHPKTTETEHLKIPPKK